MVSRETLEERERGVFTDADRDFLDAPDEFGTAAAYERKKEIKKRLANVLIDLAYFSHTDDELRVELLEGAAGELNNFIGSDEEEFVDRRAKGPVLPKALSTVYELVEGEAERIGASHDFEKVLARAVTEYDNRRTDGGTEFLLDAAGVEIEDSKKIDVEKIDQKVKAGRIHELDEHELQYVAYMSQDEFRERVQMLRDKVPAPFGEAYRSARSHYEKDAKVGFDDVAPEQTTIDDEPETDE